MIKVHHINPVKAEYNRLDATNKNKEHQLKGFQATKKNKDPWKIHLEYFIEEIDTKGKLVSKIIESFEISNLYIF